MPGKVKVLGPLLLGAGLAGAAALHAPSGLRQPAGTPQSPGTRALPAKPVEGSPIYRPEAGQRYSYRFTRTIEFDGQLGGATLPGIAFSGDFHLDVLRADEKSFEAVVSERVKEAGPRAENNVRLRLLASSRGDTLELFLPDQLGPGDEEHVSILRDLVSLWLFPLRQDTVGAYEARFDAPPGSAFRERKTKLRYLSVAPNTPELLSSRHELHWPPGEALPTRLEGEESTRLGQGSGRLTARSGYRLELAARQAFREYRSAELAALRLNAPLALDPAKARPAPAAGELARLWQLSMERLRQLSRLSPSEQLRLFGELARLLRLEPARQAELAQILLDPAVLREGGDLFRLLVGTLATAAGSEALATLRAAYEHPELSRESRSTILAALTTTEAALDPEMRRFLSEKMRREHDPRLADGAAFALGSALMKANDGEAQQAIAEIGGRWSRAGELPAKLNLLDVMGNSGRTEFLPTLLKAAADPQAPEPVRARAVFALRFVNDRAATDFLLASLASPGGELRESAAEALGLASWSESFRPPLERCAREEPLERIQERCRKTLSDHPALAAEH